MIEQGGVALGNAFVNEMIVLRFDELIKDGDAHWEEFKKMGTA